MRPLINRWAKKKVQQDRPFVAGDPLAPRTHAYEQRRLPLYRRVIPLTEEWLPRGTGWVLTVSFLSITILYGAMIGGTNQSALERVSTVFGLKVEAVLITGQKEVTEAEILSVLRISPETSLFDFRCLCCAQELGKYQLDCRSVGSEAVPEQAAGRGSGTKAFALWQRGQFVSLISYDGSVLSDHIDPEFAKLPLVVGHGAQRKASNLFELLAQYPSLARKTRAVVYVSERRWISISRMGFLPNFPKLTSRMRLRNCCPLTRMDH